MPSVSPTYPEALSKFIIVVVVVFMSWKVWTLFEDLNTCIKLLSIFQIRLNLDLQEMKGGLVFVLSCA